MHIHEMEPSTLLDIPKKWKKGVRVLGVSESFQRTDQESIVAGVVMRGDMRIDGVSFCLPSVGGMDATARLVDMFKIIDRSDIHAWMLGGCIISWFNVIDSCQLFEETKTPVICVSYHPSEGIESYIKEYFPNDWNRRVETMDKSGERVHATLHTGHKAFLTSAGIGFRDALQLVDQFTLDGRVPEPIRIARIAAAACRRDVTG
ncbi:MAG: DUF99 family protein [Candidatus Thorarchaeota archaeon]|nr:DUF99 family protein [Candidatus Thorarchaeota archaeon]